MYQRIEKPTLSFLLPLAVGAVLCGLGFASVPTTFAQPADGPIGASPAASSSRGSGPLHAVPSRLPTAAPALSGQRGTVAVPLLRIRHAETDPVLQRPTFGLSTSDRWEALRREVVAPGFLVGSLAIGLSDHLTDDPSAWRGDAAGYALRSGSTAGRLLIEAGATHGIAAALRLDPRFTPRRTGGVGPRLRHAVLAAVTARAPHGTRVPNVPRWAGTYGAALIEQQWAYGDTRVGDAALTLALSVGIDVAVNVVTEFAASR